MIPYWNNQAGNRFAIVLKGYFSDEDSAQQQFSRMPTELTSQGRVLSHWENDTVFFANPFSGRRAEPGSIVKSGAEKSSSPAVY